MGLLIGRPSRTHCRCRRCGARQVKKMPLEWYKFPPRCRQCGRRELREDKWMNERDTRATKCTCDGYSVPPFPHRRGSRFCHFRADGSRREMGDPDWQDQYYEHLKETGHEPNDDVPF